MPAHPTLSVWLLRARTRTIHGMNGCEEQWCGGCSKYLLDPRLPLAKHGFNRCQQLPIWVTLSERARCHFYPS